MSEHDALHQRGKALEDEFFYRVDQKLGQDLRRRLQRDEARQRLTAATGFAEEQLLNHLLDAGFDTPSLASLALVPLVFVAWADGSVTPQERRKVLSEALHRGIMNQPDASKLVEGWLAHRPPQSLWNLWTEYADAVRASMDPALAEILGNEIMRAATSVAEASSAGFGQGKVSRAERDVLGDIAETVQ